MARHYSEVQQQGLKCNRLQGGAVPSTSNLCPKAFPPPQIITVLEKDTWPQTGGPNVPHQTFCTLTTVRQSVRTQAWDNVTDTQKCSENCWRDDSDSGRGRTGAAASVDGKLNPISLSPPPQKRHWTCPVRSDPFHNYTLNSEWTTARRSQTHVSHLLYSHNSDALMITGRIWQHCAVYYAQAWSCILWTQSTDENVTKQQTCTRFVRDSKLN